MKEIEILRALWAYEKPNYTEKEIRDAIEKAIKALEAQRWIPVTERLPDKMGSYITTINCGKYGFATGQRYFFNDEIGWNDKDVIAWMPLPEPYTKEETT